MFGIGDKVLAMIGGGVSVLLAVALAFTIISKNAEIRTLDRAINDPVKGYAANLKAANSDLATCKVNTSTLTGALAVQNDKLKEAEAKAQQRIGALTDQLASSRQAAVSAERRAAAIMAARPSEDVCASADTLILENVR